MKNIVKQPMTTEKAITILQNGKNHFLDEKHLDWKVMTYSRNYVEFLEMDFEGLKREAKEFQRKDLINPQYLQSYLMQLEEAYKLAKLYLEID